MSLNSVAEIERAIESLSPHEVAELYAWFDEHYPQPIDARLSSDKPGGIEHFPTSRAHPING